MVLEVNLLFGESLQLIRLVHLSLFPVYSAKVTQSGEHSRAGVGGGRSGREKGV